MSQDLLYRTILKLPGPWFISSKDLLALDELVDQITGDTTESNRTLTVLLSEKLNRK